MQRTVSLFSYPALSRGVASQRREMESGLGPDIKKPGAILLIPAVDGVSLAYVCSENPDKNNGKQRKNR